MSLSLIFTITASLLALFGVAIVVRTIRRARERSVCQGCRYSLAGLPAGAACPECGMPAGPGRHRRVVWVRRAIAVVLGLVCMAILPLWLAKPAWFRSIWWSVRYARWTQVSSVVDGRWMIRTYDGGRPDNFLDRRSAVFRDGALIYEDEENRLVEFVSAPTRAGTASTGTASTGTASPALRADVTGDGVPELFVEAYSGGAHCCYTLLVVSEVGERSILATIDFAHSGPTVIDYDADGVHEIELLDWTFAYWNTSFAESPAPTVVLRWNGSAFVPSVRHMRDRGPQPSAAEILASVAKSNQLTTPERHWPTVAVWSTMLRLMYTGHEALAWQVLAEATTGHEQESAAFKSEFLKQLDLSPYWPAIKAGYERGD